MKLDRIRIPRSDLELAGLAYVPDGPPRPVCAALSHGFTASKESMDLLAAYLAARGYPCITWDCRGHKLGATGGRLDDLQQVLHDLRAVAESAMRRFGTERCALVGHSMGGILGIAAAPEIPGVAGVCAIAVGPEPAAGFRHPAGQAMLAQRADYVDGMEPLALLEQLGTLAQSVARLGSIPSLFVAARGDILVKPSKLEAMAAQAGPKAEFVEIEGSHLEAPDRARGTVANWLDRVVG